MPYATFNGKSNSECDTEPADIYPPQTAVHSNYNTSNGEPLGYGTVTGIALNAANKKYLAVCNFPSFNNGDFDVVIHMLWLKET